MISLSLPQTITDLIISHVSETFFAIPLSYIRYRGQYIIPPKLLSIIKIAYLKPRKFVPALRRFLDARKGGGVQDSLGFLPISPRLDPLIIGFSRRRDWYGLQPGRYLLSSYLNCNKNTKIISSRIIRMKTSWQVPTLKFKIITNNVQQAILISHKHADADCFRKIQKSNTVYYPYSGGFLLIDCIQNIIQAVQ